MNWLINFVAELVYTTRQITKKKWSFFGLFACAFFTSVFLLARADLLPSQIPTTVGNLAVASTVPVLVPARVELPIKIEIPTLSLSSLVVNPTSTSLELLDTALLSGAVRYPTSAKLGENGNVVLFGHSSYLPIVKNQAYKVFNEIQKLKAGDRIEVSSGEFVYVYTVRSVSRESVDDNKPIPILTSGKVLTLVTCNSFATKSDRFVVTADFVESNPAST